MSKVDKIKGFDGIIYRDDGLGVSDLPKRVIEHSLKKQLIGIFSEQDLKIIVEAPQKIVNFLNITMDLNTGRYKVFIKENSELLYVCSGIIIPKI